MAAFQTKVALRILCLLVLIKTDCQLNESSKTCCLLRDRDEPVDRMVSLESEPTQEGYKNVHPVESIEQLTPQHVHAFRDLANKPMPPLPKHFLKPTT